MTEVKEIRTSYDTDVEAARLIGFNGEGVRDDWGLSPVTKDRLAKDDVEWLAGLLDNEDWRVRLEGVRSLGLIRDARTVAYLIRALQDEDDRVSSEARGFLRNISKRLTDPAFCC